MHRHVALHQPPSFFQVVFLLHSKDSTNCTCAIHTGLSESIPSPESSTAGLAFPLTVPFSAPCLQCFQPWRAGWEKEVNLAQNIHTKQNSLGSGTISAEGRKANKGMWAWLLDRSFIKVKFRILSLSDSTELKSHTQWKQDISYTSEK